MFWPSQDFSLYEIITTESRKYLQSTDEDKLYTDCRDTKTEYDFEK